MAELQQNSWGGVDAAGNPRGYISLVYDEASLDVTSVVCANAASRPEHVVVVDQRRGRVVLDETLPVGTPRTEFNAPPQLVLAPHPDGGLVQDRFSISTNSV